MAERFRGKYIILGSNKFQVCYTDNPFPPL